MTITQAGSALSLSLPVNMVVGVSTLTSTISATGTLFNNGTFQGTQPQVSQNVGSETIITIENFNLSFTGSTATNDAGAAAGGSYSGSWTTTEQTTGGTGGQKPANCTRNAVVSGNL